MRSCVLYSREQQNKGEKKYLKIRKNAAAIILLSTLLMLSMEVSVLGQVTFPPGTKIPTYAFINVAPNPIGVGQSVTVNFFLATPMENNERPTNMNVKITAPDGTVRTLGPFTGDTTGGSFTTFVPSHTATYY